MVALTGIEGVGGRISRCHSLLSDRYYARPVRALLSGFSVCLRRGTWPGHGLRRIDPQPGLIVGYDERYARTYGSLLGAGRTTGSMARDQSGANRPEPPPPPSGPLAPQESALVRLHHNPNSLVQHPPGQCAPPTITHMKRQLQP